MIVTRNSSNIWNTLSDAWRTLEGRETIEGVWDTISSGVDCLMQHTMDVQNSRSFQYMPSLINDGPVEFTFIVSGLQDQVNVLPSLESELFRYYIDDWTLSIPTMSQQYLSSGIMATHTYYEGLDYTISGMNTLRWLTVPAWDTRYPMVEAIYVVAPIVNRINPVLMNTWARTLDFDYDAFSSYSTYGNDRYVHLKYLIWALVYKQLQSPTLQNLQDGLSIAIGAPFAYNSGIVNYTGNGMTVGNDTYVIPSALARIPNGTVVNKFDVLTTAVKLNDYYSIPTLVGTGGGTNALNQFNTVHIDLSSTRSFEYDADFFAHYRDTILPIQFRKVYASTTVFAGTWGSGVFLSIDNDVNWVAANSGLTDLTVNALLTSGTTLFVGTGTGGIYRSIDNASNWVQINNGLPGHNVRALVALGTSIYAGIYGYGVFRSTDNGANWTAVNTDLGDMDVSALAVSGTNLFAGTWGCGVYLYSDIGASWHQVNTGLTNGYVRSFAVSGTNLFIGTGTGVFLSTNNGTNWTWAGSGIPGEYVNSFAVSGTNLFAGSSGGGVYVSTNNGTSWTAVGLATDDVWSLGVSGNNLFAGTNVNGVFLSTNNGTSWSAASTGLPNAHVNAFAILSVL